MDRSLTTWHHNLKAPAPPCGKTIIEYLKTICPIPFQLEKGGLMAHKALKAHTSTPLKTK
jgi:hypothetical protein